MSRIGRQPIEIPSGVDVTVGEDAVVTVKGPRGTLSQRLHPEMRIVREEGVVRVERPSDESVHRSLHGLTRTLLANMVEGVTKGYEKRLAIVGVGYRVALKGSDLEIQVGYSHPVSVPAPEGIEFEVPTATSIVVRGNDKQQVGEVAAKADCNQLAGTYTTTSGGGLTVTPGPSTIVACEDGSYGDLYVLALTNASSFAIADNQLTISLADQGTLVYK